MKIYPFQNSSKHKTSQERLCNDVVATLCVCWDDATLRGHAESRMPDIVYLYICRGIFTSQMLLRTVDIVYE